jgi:2-oxo-4-hydroxy-4-carboxy-5-ureidoimidazoline decarboxylase
MEPWRRFNLASPDEARAQLEACCGSARWVERMLSQLPFASRDALLAAAREEWFALTPDEWREAFRHHPRIGDREALRARFPGTAHLSEREQAGIAGAPDAILDALAEANRAYAQKFGYIFIVCATGKSAGEMLAMLRTRLLNGPDAELRIAAEEQAKITALRLEGGH